MDWMMANWITVHSLFSLNWDEWASIIAILTAVVAIIHWALSRAQKQLFAPVNQAILSLKQTLDDSNARLDLSETRLDKGDKLFIRHDEELKDHERRLTDLEGHGYHENY